MLDVYPDTTKKGKPSDLPSARLPKQFNYLYLAIATAAAGPKYFFSRIRLALPVSSRK
jgi:hypothetical protein